MGRPGKIKKGRLPRVDDLKVKLDRFPFSLLYIRAEKGIFSFCPENGSFWFWNSGVFIFTLGRKQIVLKMPQFAFREKDPFSNLLVFVSALQNAPELILRSVGSKTYRLNKKTRYRRNLELLGATYAERPK